VGSSDGFGSGASSGSGLGVSDVMGTAALTTTAADTTVTEASGWQSMSAQKKRETAVPTARQIQAFGACGRGTMMLCTPIKADPVGGDVAMKGTGSSSITTPVKSTTAMSLMPKTAVLMPVAEARWTPIPIAGVKNCRSVFSSSPRDSPQSSSVAVDSTQRKQQDTVASISNPFTCAGTVAPPTSTAPASLAIPRSGVGPHQTHHAFAQGLPPTQPQPLKGILKTPERHQKQRVVIKREELSDIGWDSLTDGGNGNAKPRSSRSDGKTINNRKKEKKLKKKEKNEAKLCDQAQGAGPHDELTD